MLTSFATGYCALDDVPSRIPLESQDGHGSSHRVNHLQDFDGEAFEKQCEATMGSAQGTLTDRTPC
jgi:hypothetical protein